MADELSGVELIEAAVDETNQVALADPIRAALVADLGPIAARVAVYAKWAECTAVTDKATADEAAAICNRIAADVRAVRDHEVLSRITTGLHNLHRKWTGLRDAFTAPMEASRKQIKGKVIAWQQEEQRKAAEIQRKLQAESDERARRERERLEKQAAAAKKPETQERYQEAAAAVVAPTVVVEAPKSGLRVSKVWKVKAIDHDAFFAALVTRPELRGFVTINETLLERSRAANALFSAPGVVFEQQVR